MTSKERVEKLRCLITCMKCEVSGKECDNNCPTQYDTGNMGEIIENLEEIAKALEQEPCEDCVSRQAVKDMLDARGVKAVMTFEHFKELLDKLPPVTPQPKTGHWIDIMVGDMSAQACDRCNTFYPLAYTGGGHKYCPNCGAKMESEG